MNIITEKNYVDKAESVINDLKNLTDKRTGRSIQMVTTSKIRNLLSMSADIYNKVLIQREEELSEEIIGQIDYLRMRFVYESGKDESVKNLVMRAQILDILKEIKGSRKNYILFNKYMEALIAFHKFNGGKDY